MNLTSLVYYMNLIYVTDLWNTVWMSERSDWRRKTETLWLWASLQSCFDWSHTVQISAVMQWEYRCFYHQKHNASPFVINYNEWTLRLNFCLMLNQVSQNYICRSGGAQMNQEETYHISCESEIRHYEKACQYFYRRLNIYLGLVQGGRK
jgi:hypothetical protein